MHAEIYYPPYLYDAVGQFRAAPEHRLRRPTRSKSGRISQIDVGAARISRVTLVKTGSVTHSVNMDQRFVELPFTASSGTLFVQMPTRATDTPPGYYLLFVDRRPGRAVAREDRAHQHRGEPGHPASTTRRSSAARAARRSRSRATRTRRWSASTATRAGTYVNRVGARCVAVDQAGRWIGDPVQPRVRPGTRPARRTTRTCPRDSAISGFRGRSAQYVDQLDFECRALTASGRVTGAAQYLGAVGGTGGTPQGPFNCSHRQPGLRAHRPLGRLDRRVRRAVPAGADHQSRHQHAAAADEPGQPGRQRRAAGHAERVGARSGRRHADATARRACRRAWRSRRARASSRARRRPRHVRRLVTVGDGTETTTASLTWTIADARPAGTRPDAARRCRRWSNTPVSYTATTRNGINTQYRWYFDDGTETGWSTSPAVDAHVHAARRCTG